MPFEKVIIPEMIKEEAEIALSHYPELAGVPITFKIRDSKGKSFMMAQPVWKTMLGPRRKRSYVVLIQQSFKVEDHVFTIDDIPQDVMIGWLGHELGHIMDYLHRGKLDMLWFGLRYLYSSDYLKRAERAADEYAVGHGLGEYIIKTKNFILNNCNLSEKYKARIRKYYLSPEEITSIVNK